MPNLTKILLVDDNPKYLEDVLPLYGYDLTCAKSGEQALKFLSENTGFDMVLLDVMLPDITGWEILKTIRKNSRLNDLPVIMVTAVGDNQKMIAGLKTGADDYIVKPFILPNLLARIEAVLRRTKRQNPSGLQNNVTNIQADNFITLTKREKDVLLLVTQGESNKSVAEKLVLSEVTVKSHLNNIFKKLHVSNRTQAVLLAMQMNITN